MRRLMSGRHWPNKQNCLRSQPPTDMLVGWGPEPRFCSFVFSHEIFKPSGAAAVLELDKQDAASPIDGSNSAVSSAYTRSAILELPMLIPGRTDMCSKIQSIATQNSVGARMHPCLTPDVLWNRPDSLDPIRTRAPVDWWRASISWVSVSGMTLLRSAFQNAMRSTPDGVERRFDVKVGHVEWAIKLTMQLRQKPQGKNSINS